MAPNPHRALLLVAVLLVGGLVPSVTAAAAAAPADGLTASGSSGDGRGFAATTPHGEKCGSLDEYQNYSAYNQCLADHTSRQQVLEIITMAPSSASQKQIDRVYAVHPEYSDQKGLTAAEQEQVTEWITWEKTGVAPEWADESQATPADGGDAQAAVLHVREPAYADGDVQRESSSDGTPVYVVQGERIRITPENFNGERVVEFGVESPGGQLSWDDQFKEFVFSPGNETGTFRLYWVAVETEEVGGNNSTRTRATEVRYEAIVKVDGGVNLQHVEEGSIGEMQADARKWREWNGTVQEVRDQNLLMWAFRGGPPSTQTVLQGMVNTYVSTRDPVRFLSGSFTAILSLIAFTLGGYLFIVFAWGPPLHLIRNLTKQLRRYRSTDHVEGTMAERLLEIEDQRRDLAWANDDWDDHRASPEADALRGLGDTPREAFEELMSLVQPATWLRDRLEVMGLVGWGVEVDRSEDGSLEDARLVPPDDYDGPSGDGATAADGGNPLYDLEEDVVAALAADARVREFDLLDAEYDPADLETTPTTLDLDSLVGELDDQLEWFDDEAAVAESLHEWLADAAQRPVTDDHGRPRPARRLLNWVLSEAQYARDVHKATSLDVYAEHIEAALVHEDAVGEAYETVEEVRDGRRD